MTTPKTKCGSVDTRRETARLLAVLEEHPGGMTIRELTEARDATRGDLPKLSESQVRYLVAGMPEFVQLTYDAVTRPSGTEVWSARKLAPTIPIDTHRDNAIKSINLRRSYDPAAASVQIWGYIVLADGSPGLLPFNDQTTALQWYSNPEPSGSPYHTIYKAVLVTVTQWSPMMEQGS